MTTVREQNPRMAWKSADLPGAYYAFKAHREFMFGGPLEGKNEEQRCNYRPVI